MATKTINTRIKNRVDSLTNWQKTGVELLPGEIALVKVTTQQIDETTGNVVNVPAVLMKVGESDGNGGTKAFNELPWLSAKASDVYDWAKGATAEGVNVTAAGTTTTKSLGDWFKYLDSADSTNASNISKNTAAITLLNNNDSTSGSVAYKIKQAIDALDSTTSGSGNFVKTVTQTNGKVTVTYGNIAESELPNISASKIIVDSTNNTTLATKLSTVDSDIADLKSKQSGHTDAQINTLIDAKINALDVADSGTGYVTKVTQTDGKISVTKSALPTASTSAAGIVKLGATGGAATYDAIYGTDGNGGINKQVETNTSDIANLKTSVAGGVHFRGTVTAAPTSSTTTVNGKAVEAGDVVIYDGKEYIYTSSAWEQLGDVTRIGNLETKINNLDVTDTAQSNQFVTAVSQADGKITVSRAQPTSANIKHGDSSTVSAKLADQDSKISAVENQLNGADTTSGTVAYKIKQAIGALDFTAPTASGSTTSFIDSVSQADGKITATKKNITSASTSTKGIVQLHDTIDTTTDKAATPNIVKTAYDLASTANTAASDAQTRVAAIESDYVRVVGDQLYIGKSGADTIIFDCGGAELSTGGASYSMRMTTPTVSEGSNGVLEIPGGNASDLTSVEINGETVPSSSYSIL